MTLSIRGIPSELGTKLIEEFLEIKKRFAMNDWGPGQLKGGRFAEVVLRAYQHLLSEAVTPFGTDIPASEKTRVLNTVQSAGAIDAHVRQKTVPLVRLLLDFRNNRDAAHLGGFDANSMDTLFVMTSATWIFCEFVRVVELVVFVDVEVAYVLVLGRRRRRRTQRRAAEESHFDVPREAMKAEHPALAVDAIEGRVPFDGLAHAGDGAHDERVEAAPDVAFPAWHGCDVGLHRQVAVGLRDLGVAACEEGRLLPFTLKLSTCPSG
jgi:hypothetical protein